MFFVRFGWNLVWRLIMGQKQHRMSLKCLRPVFDLYSQVVSGIGLHNAMASYVAYEALFNCIVFRHCTIFRYLIAVAISNVLLLQHSKFENGFSEIRGRSWNVAISTHSKSRQRLIGDIKYSGEICRNRSLLNCNICCRCVVQTNRLIGLPAEG